MELTLGRIFWISFFTKWLHLKPIQSNYFGGMQVLLASCLCDHSTVPNPWQIPENIKICRSQKLRISWTGVAEFQAVEELFLFATSITRTAGGFGGMKKLEPKKL